MKLMNEVIKRTPSGSIKKLSTITPAIASKELLVEMLYIGICGTDLEIITGARKDPVSIIGHEGVGRVIEIGSCYKGKYLQGDIVAFRPHNHINQDVIIGHSVDGLYQQKRVVTEQEIENNLIVPVNQDLPQYLVPLCEPLGTLIYSDQIMNAISPDPSAIAIFGAGMTGILYAMYCKVRHPRSQVILINRSQESLTWAVENNIVEPSHCISMDDDVVAAVNRLTNNKGVNHSLLSVGSAGTADVLSLAVAVSAENGCIDCYTGFNQDYVVPGTKACFPYTIRRENVAGFPETPYFEQHAVNGKNICFTGHRGLSAQHVQQALDVIHEHSELFKKIVSHVVSFDEAVDILNNYKHHGMREYNDTRLRKVIIKNSV